MPLINPSKGKDENIDNLSYSKVPSISFGKKEHNSFHFLISITVFFL